MLLDELADAVFGNAACLGDAGSLEEGCIRGDVGIETGAGRGDQIYGHGMAGVLLGQLVDGALDASHKGLVGLGQVGTARGSGIVAVAGGRWPGVEVLVRGEALGDQLGADDLAVLEDEASRSLVREDDAGNRGDNERITDSRLFIVWCCSRRA